MIHEVSTSPHNRNHSRTYVTSQNGKTVSEKHKRNTAPIYNNTRLAAFLPTFKHQAYPLAKQPETLYIQIKITKGVLF